MLLHRRPRGRPTGQATYGCFGPSCLTPGAGSAKYLLVELDTEVPGRAEGSVTPHPPLSLSDTYQRGLQERGEGLPGARLPSARLWAPLFLFMRSGWFCGSRCLGEGSGRRTRACSVQIRVGPGRGESGAVLCLLPGGPHAPSKMVSQEAADSAPGAKRPGVGVHNGGLFLWTPGIF